MLFLSDFDDRITKFIRHLPDLYQPIMAGVSFVGEPIIVVIIGFSGLVSARIRGQSAIEHAFIYAVVAFALNISLKMVLHRARPQGLIVRTLGLKSYSFPSGHAFGTVIFYGLFAYLDLKYLAHPWSYLIGVSRIYLGAHYPSDVLGGWLLGLISLTIISAIAF
jgi:undecaprenyl-diphosphatase